jgi:uncharacterized protein YbgA (DUF1722 family)/uncharacterized protein YbbK (DUF523 family)
MAGNASYLTVGSPETPSLRLGVSACLLGEQVRYDGGHKRDLFLLNTLGAFVQWVPVCPEVEIGLGTPREAIRLVGEVDDPRLVGVKSERDLTDTMRTWARGQLEGLAALRLHGYVLKKNSPSCGLFRVRVYDHNDVPARTGRGIYADELVKRLPLLPVEEEGRLHDLPLRENFIERVFAYYRWTRLLDEDPTPGGLVRFHTAHKMTLMAHDPAAQRALGRIVAGAGDGEWEAIAGDYGQGFMAALGKLATAKRHTNVLQHLMGYLKDDLSRENKAELLGLIEDYRLGLVPLIVPLTLLKHHLRRHDVPDWMHQQVYLNPYPKELMLRNHV